MGKFRAMKAKGLNPAAKLVQHEQDTAAYTWAEEKVEVVEFPPVLEPAKGENYTVRNAKVEAPKLVEGKEAVGTPTVNYSTTMEKVSKVEQAAQGEPIAIKPNDTNTTPVARIEAAGKPVVEVVKPVVAKPAAKPAAKKVVAKPAAKKPAAK